MNKIKIALIGNGVTSGGLVAVLRDVLAYEITDPCIEITLFCSEVFYNCYLKYIKDINIHISKYLVDTKLSNVLSIKYSKGFIHEIEEYNPNAVFFITGSYKKGLEKYRLYFILNNQLLVDYKRILSQKSIKTEIQLMLKSLLLHRSIKDIDVMFFSSVYSKEDAQKYLNVNESYVVPFACNNIFREDKKINERKISKDNLNLLYVSSIIPYKNQDKVIKAVLYLKQLGYTPHLQIIGKIISKKYYRNCCDLIKKYGLQDNVKFIEWVEFEKIPYKIDNTDIYINASEIDTCGTSVEEGMARGAIVIASDVPFNREMMGESGLYFNLETPFMLAQNIDKIVNDVELQNNLRQHACQRSGGWTLKDTAEEYFKYIIEDCKNG